MTRRFTAIIVLLSTSAFAAATKLDTSKIDQITGMQGKLSEKDGVYKLSYPRKDLHVIAAGVKINPAMGLTAWTAFTKIGDHATVMGDIVLTEDQVNPVMSAALDHGLVVTALHNHFFFDTPKIMFMHVGGMGSEEQLATGVKAVFDTLKSTAGKKLFPRVSIDPAQTSLDPKKIDAIFGTSGELKDGVYKLTFGKTTSMDGHEVGAAMGVNTWAAFSGSDQNAIVDGDFAIHEDELQGVLKALRKSDIDIVAIHNHMVTENPKIMFLHYWGVGPTVELARGIKAALR